MQRYNPKDIEAKWQQAWSDQKLYKAVDFDESRPKFVMLTEFPYPSGDGLHLGHTREYTLGDVIARHKRMTGHNVLYPMGYDAFGLPTENYAIKNKIPPQVATDRNVANFQQQFESLGYSIDWSRSFRTTDPDYYKWTQWLFLQFYKAGLAYQDEIAINWCPKCKTGLANEEVVNGVHERCDTSVEKKFLKQWLLKITEYAERLIKGLKNVDYPSRIADQQINWIGRSKGAEVNFKLAGSDKTITVFTTRPNTLFGATFMVLAPEHEFVKDITTEEQRETVEQYVKAAQAKSEIERQDTNRDKTGVFTGAYAVNPANDEKVPVWIADYVLTGYGTGAIMAVPAHDERDYEFAQKFDLPMRQVVAPKYVDANNPPRDGFADVHRQVINAIIKHPTEDKYAMLRWTHNNYRTFVFGGIEAGETAEEAARREILEETGFKSFKSIKSFGSQFISQYYAAHKNENRTAYVQGVYVELDDVTQEEVSAEELAKHTVEWVAFDQVLEGQTGVEPVQLLPMLHSPVAVRADEGYMINSGDYDGLPSAEARDKIVADLAARGVAKERVNYRLRDWIFSRQHYWGEPIPIIHCENCGAVPVSEDQLPVELPPVEQYEPTDTGESPLAAIDEWVRVPCPQCEGPAKRETDTMPNWAGSSWYYLRYYDAHNDQAFADRKKLDYWGAVDLYLGGMEHTTLHLLYSRFWHQFFYDQGLVPTPEPYKARRGQGIILAQDGSKMSKSKGNVVNPTDIIDQGYGADALRMAIVFLAPYDQTTPWNPEGVAGTFRFLQRVWTLVQEQQTAKSQEPEDRSQELLRVAHKAIKKVSEDLHEMSFNTAVAALMEFVNELYKIKAEDGYASRQWPFVLESLLRLLAPFAPHMTEELWQQLGHEGSVHTSEWPVHEEKHLVSDILNIVVQVNGKVRANIEVPADSSEERVVDIARADTHVQDYVAGAEVRKTIYVPKKLVNFVV